MANASKLLHTETDPENYLANLKPEDSRIRKAKTKIRVHLRAAFEASSEALFGRPVRPRFFTQGSYAYKTLNDPAHPPDQQMDLDDGCYLPLSFVRGTRPSTAAEKFFEFVDAALDDLAEREGWRRESKPTCCRVVIAHDSHVDIPLYAIPDDQFRLPRTVGRGPRTPPPSSRRRGTRGTTCRLTRSSSPTAKRAGRNRTHARSTSGSRMRW